MILAVVLAVTLEARLADLAAPARGVVGIAAWHLESGRRVAVRGDEAFPMASVYKLPIAIAFLRGVEKGEVQIADSVKLGMHWWRPGRSPLSVRLEARGPLRVAWTDLLTLALKESDNAAADILLARAGGPAAVMRRLGELGVRGVEVSRSEGAIAMAMAGVDPPLPEARWSKQLFDSVSGAAGEKVRDAAKDRYDRDPRDASTPAGAVALLAALHRGQALNREHTALVLGAMRASTTGQNRIRGLLPKGTVVADKTGTNARTANDVGLIRLPGGGYLALAVFIKGSQAKIEERERVIARIARALYDVEVERAAASE